MKKAEKEQFLKERKWVQWFGNTWIKKFRVYKGVPKGYSLNEAVKMEQS